jgi:hypothetical protein
LVTGGYNPADGVLASAELYDPASNVWSSDGAMAFARSGQTATLLSSGKVLVAAGYSSGYLSSAEIYDAANSFSTSGIPILSRWSLILLVAMLLAFGLFAVCGPQGDLGGLREDEA